MCSKSWEKLGGIAVKFLRIYALQDASEDLADMWLYCSINLGNCN